MGAAAATELSLGLPAAFEAPRGVRRLEIGGRALLHDARRQQLFRLNETADLIWRGLAQGMAPGEVAAALHDVGAADDDAARFVADTVQAWVLGGQLVPRAALEALAATPNAVRTLTLDELSAELAFHGDVGPEACDATFDHLYGPLARPPRRLAIVGHGDLAFLFGDGEPLAATPPEGLAATMKAELTELYVNGVEGAFLTHGALLVLDGKTLVLSGEPGAGKTTLSLALAAHGWTYGGDDIVRIEPDGQACAAPFAAAVKSGAWPVLRGLWPQIDDLPTWLRADGQQVRYLRPPSLAERTPRPLDAVLLLARREGVRAELQPIEPLEALSAILESAYAAKWRLDGDALVALASGLEAATCQRLVYCDLEEAVSAVGALTDA